MPWPRLVSLTWRGASGVEGAIGPRAALKGKAKETDAAIDTNSGKLAASRGGVR